MFFNIFTVFYYKKQNDLSHTVCAQKMIDRAFYNMHGKGEWVKQVQRNKT